MIGVMADSHDNIVMVRKAVSLFREMKCDLVIHAGDFIAPFAARELGGLSCPVKAVFGNCDGEKEGLRKTIEAFGEIAPEPLAFKYAGKNFLVTHVHHSLKSYLLSSNYDVIIYGHTHKPAVKRKERVLLLNPGETGGWLSGKSTVALLDPLTLEADVIPL